MAEDQTWDLRSRIERDYISSMKSRESARTSVLRMLKASVQSADKAKGSPLSEEELVGVVGREVKLRRESIGEFERGGRPDLVGREQQALEILSEYQPRQLTDEELRELVRTSIDSLNEQAAGNPRGSLGIVMKRVMPQVRGRADGARVSSVAMEMLAASGEA